MGISRWWRQLGLGHRIAYGLLVSGLGLVGSSLVPGPGLDEAWLRDFLMTVGSSMALFAPFYLITRSLDRHLDQVATQTAKQVEGVRAETAQQVADIKSEAVRASAALADQVDALRADVDRRLSDVSDRVAERLAIEAAADQEAFQSLRIDAPTRSTVWEALVRAQQLGLANDDRPPRVKISDSQSIYVSFQIDTDQWADEPLAVRIEELSGRVTDWVPWPAETDAEEILVDVGRILLKYTNEVFNPGAFFVGLADLLEVALSDPERRPVVQLCPPQWVICEWGLITYGDTSRYTVPRDRVAEVSQHVLQKPWVDRNSWDDAYETVQALYPTRLWGEWTNRGEPPF